MAERFKAPVLAPARIAGAQAQANVSIANVKRAQRAAEAKTGWSRTVALRGSVAERFKAPVLKTGDGASHP